MAFPAMPSMNIPKDSVIHFDIICRDEDPGQTLKIIITIGGTRHWNMQDKSNEGYETFLVGERHSSEEVCSEIQEAIEETIEREVDK